MRWIAGKTGAMNLVVRGFGLGLIGMGFGCVSKQVCVVGETQICFCAGASEGAQACRDDQTGWSECDCGGGSLDTQDTGSSNSFDGAELYDTYCSNCHASDASGVCGIGPDIREDVSEESISELVEVILEGEDNMPAIPVSRPEAVAIASWLKHVFSDSDDHESDDD